MQLMKKPLEVIGVAVRQFTKPICLSSPRFHFNQIMTRGYVVVILNGDGSESVFSAHHTEGAARQDRDLVLELIA